MINMLRWLERQFLMTLFGSNTGWDAESLDTKLTSVYGYANTTNHQLEEEVDHD